jgi:hypothetical protein
MVFPQVSELCMSQNGDVGIRKGLTQAQQGRRGHNGIAQPVNAPD